MKKNNVIAVVSIVAIFFCWGTGRGVFAMGSKPSETVKQQQKAVVDAKKAAAEQEKTKKNVAEAKKIIIARVNGDEISMYSLVRTMNRIVPRYVAKGENITPEITEKVRQKALNDLIFRELAIQEAIKQGITIGPTSVEKVVSKVKEGLGSEEAYKKYLDNFGFTEESFRKQIERGHQFELITKREIYGKVSVDPKKIKAEYEKIRKEGKLHMPDKYIVKDVLLMAGNDDKTTKKRAASLLAEIKKNKYDIGKLVLDGTFITRRINVSKKAYPGIYKAMAKMKAGDTSGVIKDKGSYHIVQVVTKEPARDQTLEEARGFIENRLRVPAQDERRAQWEKEMRKGAKIEIMLDQVEKELKESAKKGSTENHADVPNKKQS